MTTNLRFYLLHNCENYRNIDFSVINKDPIVLFHYIYIRMENKCFYARVSLDQVVQVMVIFISNIFVKYKNNGRFSITKWVTYAVLYQNST